MLEIQNAKGKKQTSQEKRHKCKSHSIPRVSFPGVVRLSQLLSYRSCTFVCRQTVFRKHGLKSMKVTEMDLKNPYISTNARSLHFILLDGLKDKFPVKLLLSPRIFLSSEIYFLYHF